jgi:hypothetical protein
MRKILIIGILVVCLTAVYGYAQMGGGMMGGQQGEMMMQGEGMMGGMMQMMNQMAGMMQSISGMMREGMSAEEMRKMSEITRDMSMQMTDMSRMMGRGDVSQQEILGLEQRMMDTENRLNMMR